MTAPVVAIPRPDPRRPDAPRCRRIGATAAGDPRGASGVHGSRRTIGIIRKKTAGVRHRSLGQAVRGTTSRASHSDRRRRFGLGRRLGLGIGLHSSHGPRPHSSQGLEVDHCRLPVLSRHPLRKLRHGQIHGRRCFLRRFFIGWRRWWWWRRRRWRRRCRGGGAFPSRRVLGVGIDGLACPWVNY